MTHPWDEFSKSLAEPVPRRESLRRLGFVFAGAALSPFGLSAAWARGQQDACKAFCKCRNKSQQNQCLAACRACNGDVSRVCGSCGSGYICCGDGGMCCGGYCADLDNDVQNCGACGNRCLPGLYEVAACVDGHCVYTCAEGAADCGDGTCTSLWADPNNCGACGNVCGGSTPYCNGGVCSECFPGTTRCGDVCVYLLEDPNNCGACGVVCPAGTSCVYGACQDNVPPPSDP